MTQEKQEFLFKPELLSAERDEGRIKQLQSDASILKLNTVTKQLAEYIKLSNPSIPWTKEKLEVRVKNEYPDYSKVTTYVYYPWKRTLVAIVTEELFIQIRTNRNQLKITPEEQSRYGRATIGIVGLSVGNAVATTLAMERVGGTLVLADYDELEVSNLNRLRASLCDLDLPKTVIAARQIAEIDPFINVELFNDGITEQNLDQFMNFNGGLDILVEVCDALPLKYALRKSARKKSIPVVMDTNDRGMVDVERFDDEPSRSVFHGLVSEADFERLESLPLEERIAFVTKLVGGDAVSERLKKSMPEIGKTLTSWPQLASGVMLGGAATAHVCRSMLSGQPMLSGRYYVDMKSIFDKQV